MEMARRHVIEAEDKVARQEMLIAEMERDNHPHAAWMARRLILTVRFHLANAIAHRDRLQRGGVDPVRIVPAAALGCSRSPPRPGPAPRHPPDPTRQPRASAGASWCASDRKVEPRKALGALLPHTVAKGGPTHRYNVANHIILCNASQTADIATDQPRHTSDGCRQHVTP